MKIVFDIIIISGLNICFKNKLIFSVNFFYVYNIYYCAYLEANDRIQFGQYHQPNLMD